MLSHFLRYLQWASGLSLTIRDRYDAWDDPAAPRIRSVTAVGGCGDVVASSNVTLSGCEGGELLQLTGTHFLTRPFVMAIQATTTDDYYIINNGYLATCEELTVLSATSATCVLPQVQDYPALQYDTPYMMLLWNRTFDSEIAGTFGMRSNALFFTYASNGSVVIAADFSSSSSPSLALLVALPVSVGVLVVLLVVATARQLRNKARATRGGSNGRNTDDASGMYAEEVGVEQKQAERAAAAAAGGGSAGGWWQVSRGSRPTLASMSGSGESDVELADA